MEPHTNGKERNRSSWGHSTFLPKHANSGWWGIVGIYKCHLGIYEGRTHEERTLTVLQRRQMNNNFEHCVVWKPFPSVPWPSKFLLTCWFQWLKNPTISANAMTTSTTIRIMIMRSSRAMWWWLAWSLHILSMDWMSTVRLLTSWARSSSSKYSPTVPYLCCAGVCNWTQSVMDTRKGTGNECSRWAAQESSPLA